MGPTIGGILTQAGTWRWIFYVNVPIGAMVSLGAWRWLTGRTHRQHQGFDLPGAAFLAVGLGALTLGLSFGQEWGWSSFPFLASMVAGLVAQRLLRYAKLLGRENVMGGTDCGLGPRVGSPEIAWAKLEALAEGARLASRRLWARRAKAHQRKASGRKKAPRR